MQMSTLSCASFSLAEAGFQNLSEGMSNNHRSPKYVACSTLVIWAANPAPLRAAVADVARFTVVAESGRFETVA